MNCGANLVILSWKCRLLLLLFWWTFVSIKKVSPFINKTALHTELSPGLRIEYQDGIKLLFNRTDSGSTKFDFTANGDLNTNTGDSYSHNLRPDIVIEKIGRKLIFDAKYKGKSGRSEFYGEEDDGTIKKWKDENIDKMHCYYDAIQGVAGSFILFPGTSNGVYTAHGSNAIFEGVGALASQARCRKTERHIKGQSYWPDY